MIMLVRPNWLRKNFNGITLWPFVIARYSYLLKDKVFVNHERIHLRQQLELLIVFFFLWYGLEFLIRWIQTGNRQLAYRNISFEREAYMHENEFLYLKHRKPWSFIKFMQLSR